MHRMAFCFAAAALVAGCHTTGPVLLTDLRPGEPLRVATRVGEHDFAVHHRLVRQVNGSLDLLAGESGIPTRIALSDLRRIEVGRGRDRVKGSLTGAAAGMGAGVVAGMICRVTCTSSDGNEHYAPAIGVVIGAFGGFLVGAAVAPTKWHAVQIR